MGQRGGGEMSQAEGQRWMRSQQGQFKKRRGEEREKCEERCRYAEREIKERQREAEGKR